MRPRFQRLYPPAIAQEGPAYWMLFVGENVLLAEAEPISLLRGTNLQPDGLIVEESSLLGTLDGLPVMFAVLSANTPTVGFRTLGLRAVLAQADAEIGMLASYAAQLLRWARTSRFCPSCAHPLEPLDGWGKKCANCGYSLYPPVSPAIIVLIHDGERILLTTKPGWGARYSLVAGFVEPGETLEQCVAREVLEEVGVFLDDIRYIDSQPWPFPQQLMLGFTAHYVGGEIEIDANELSDARWFNRDELPELPPPFSIARQLIERWRSQVS